MRDHDDTTNQPELPVYEIRVSGHLDRAWADRFVGMVITLEDDGCTRLTGAVVDQAALHGLFKKMRDVGLSLLSINRIDQHDQRNP